MSEEMSLPKAINEQSCLIRICGTEVTIDCDVRCDAEELMDWLVNLEPRDAPATSQGEVGEAINELVDLLAPVLTNSMGMAASDRERRFRAAMNTIAESEQDHG